MAKTQKAKLIETDRCNEYEGGLKRLLSQLLQAILLNMHRDVPGRRLQ